MTAVQLLNMVFLVAVPTMAVLITARVGIRTLRSMDVF